jgi:hypothetical protein
MTRTTQILRQGGACVPPRAASLFARLALFEDRRRLELLQRARPDVPLDLADTLDAFRHLCRDLDNPAAARDMQALDNTEVEVVRIWLEASGFCPDTQEAWFQHAQDHHGLYATEDGEFTDTVFFCELHDAWYSRRTQSHGVVVRWRNGIWDSETWSDDAVEESAFYCDGSQQYYASNVFDSGRTVDGDTVCESWAELNGYWSDGDGHWRYGEPDDDEDDCSIPTYHDADRPWSVALARMARVAFYGLEIELCFDDEHSRLDYYEEMGFPTADLTAERDGSLDDDQGLEVISRPFSLPELRQHRNPLQRAMELAGQYEVDSPSPSGYGVHITTNAQRLTRDHRARLVDVTYDMRALTEFVAGRKNDADFYNYGNKPSREGCKYTAVNERSDGSFEFRVFRGTADWQVLLSYVEYVDALTEWTRNPANPTQGPVGQALFRAWVHATGRYPALSRRFTSTLSKEALACALPLLNRAA